MSYFCHSKGENNKYTVFSSTLYAAFNTYMSMSCFKPAVARNTFLRIPMISMRFVYSALLFFAIFCSFFSAQAADPKKGESVFKANCTSCHALDYKMTGPALKGITSTQSEDWLVKWILNNKKLRDAGDKSALAIYNEYNQAQMNIFEGILTEGDVKDVLSYLKTASDATAKVAAAGGGGGGTGGGSGGASSDSSSTWVSVGGLVLVIFVLFLVIGILNRVIKTLEGLLNRQQRLGTGTGAVGSGASGVPGTPGYLPAAGEEGIAADGSRNLEHTGPKKDPFEGVKKLARNRQFIVLVLLMTTVSLVVLSWDQMLSIGITKGYQPIQPIAYSHQLHAGQLKIACQYCHGGAYKSKYAGIPSANICMNCHAAVQLREKYNGKVSPEIAKIYTALDYNPDTKVFGQEKKPIQWVVIHQLQDFVYFNHSQHVRVGGIQCQRCHGPIQTMKQVYQYSPLTMSWCINCHRQTKVNSEGNGYYDKMLAMHNEFKHGQKVTVAQMGGIECSKCHY